MHQICMNLFKSLGFCELQEEPQRWQIIDYTATLERTNEEITTYGTELVFGVRKENMEIWCYRHSYVYIVCLNTDDAWTEGKLVIYDNWKDEEGAVLKVFKGDLVFVGTKSQVIEVVGKLLNEDANTIEKILF